MPLVFSAIVPHSPLLIPQIGKEHTDALQKTVAALQELETLLYAAKPDTLVIVSSHSAQAEDRFYINLAQHYSTDFSQFGDFATNISAPCDQELILALKLRMEESGVSAQLISEEKVDYGVGVPLFYFFGHLKDVNLVPLSQSGLDPTSHVDYGRHLQKEVQKSNKRIAVIISGDMAHSKDEPQKGQAFDQRVLQAVKNCKTSELLNVDPGLLGDATECILKPLFVLQGVMNDLQCAPQVLSYEAPFGVGHMVVYYRLS